MPIGQQAGSVYVLISGDNSQLIAAFAASQAAARAAGQKIAAALNQAATGADRTVAAIERLTVVVQQEGAAAALAAQRNLQMVASLVAVSTAAGGAATRIAGVGHAAAGAVPQMAAASGAIRVLENNMSIRAVERFATGVLGLGPLLQAAFPIVGAIALFEMVRNIAGKMGELTEAEKKAAEETKKLDDEWAQLAATFEQGEVERAALEVGKLSSLKLQQFYEDGVASRDRANLKSLQDEIQKAWAAMKTDRATATAALSSNPAVATAQALNPAETVRRLMANQDWQIQADKAKELGGQISVLTEKLKVYDEVTSKVEADRIKQQAASQSGALASRQVEARQAQLEAATRAGATEEEIEAGHQHAIVQSRIDAMKDRIAAGVAAAQEEVRVAQQSEARITADLAANIQQRIALIRAAGSAEELGKTPEELPAIRTATAGKVAALEASEGQKVLDAKQATAAAEDRLDAAIGTAHRERAEQETESAIEDLRLSGEAEDRQIRLNAEKVKAAREEAIHEQEISDRSSREARSSATGISNANADAQKSSIELDYQLQIVHTRQQQIQYASDLAQIDTNRANRAVEDAAAEVATAQALLAQLPTAQALLDLQKAQTALDEAKAKAKQAELDSQKKIASVTQSTSIQYQLELEMLQQAAGAAKSLGDALAAGIFHSRGGIGKEIEKALRGEGQHVLGDIFTAAIKEAMQASGVTAAAQKLAGVIFGTPANATTGAAATTGVLGGILGKLAGALHIPGVGITPPGTPAPPAAVSGAANAAQAAASKTAEQIQKVVEGETNIEATLKQIAAALSDKTCCQQSEQSLKTMAASAGTQTKLLGAIATGVDVMAALELISLFMPHPFGFASGGRPTPGVPAIVGENGPELFIPDIAGTVIPSVPSFSGGIASSLTNSMSVNSASHQISIGAIHMHGVRDMRDVARRLPDVLKATNPAFSPASN